MSKKTCLSFFSALVFLKSLPLDGLWTKGLPRGEVNDKKPLQRDGAGSVWPQNRKEVFMEQKEGQCGWAILGRY